MSQSLEQLIQVYQQLLPLANNNPLLNNDTVNFHNIKTIFDDKIANPSFTVMVYGVYNAGKSSLINAMIGKEVAPVDDIPLTDTVTEYSCGNYKVVDTPGIDAPLAHEKVTMQEMLKADAIIFVVNPTGVAEERKTLDVLLDLLKQGKKVFLVFNLKSPLSDNDYLILKEQTYNLLQELAEQHGLSDVLKDIPICKVNAKTALKARIKDSQKLLQHSGYLDFDKKLDEFINSISDSDINARLELQLVNYLKIAIARVEENSTNALVNGYDNLIKMINKNKIHVRQEINYSIRNKRNELYRQIKSWLYNETTDIENKIQDRIEKVCDLLDVQLRNLFEEQQISIQDEINELQTLLPKLSISKTVDSDKLHIQPQEIEEESNIEEVNPINLDNINVAVKTLQTTVKVEHVIEGLNLVKALLPRLMKGVGEKTIEKIATATVSKALPYVGTAIQIGMALRDVLGNDEETERLRREQERAERARERWQQQIEDVSYEVSSEFENNLIIGCNSAINEFFDSILGELNKIQNQFSELDKANSQLLEELYSIQQNIKSYSK